MALGFLLGSLIGLAANQLGLYQPSYWNDIFLLPALLGMMIARTKARSWLWAAAIVLVLGLMVVGYSPLVPFLMRGLTRTDVLRPCPAVVVLSSSIHKDKTLEADAQSRVLQGYLLLRQRYAPCLVLTDATVPFGAQAPTVRRQMAQLAFNYPVDEVGPVGTTHDEAVCVARLARQRGWKQVILVTHPWHMRRAAAAFEKAGLPVLCAPCPEESYDLRNPNDLPGHWKAFRDWLHETVGYQVYRYHGWV